MNLISARDVMPNSSRWVIVDVRTPAEFSRSRIAGSINWPPDAPDELESLARRSPVLLVCQTGARARKAAEEIGNDEKIDVLKGGLTAWYAAGGEFISASESAPDSALSSLERQARVFLGTLILASAGLGFAHHTAWFCIPLFLGLSMVFSGLMNFCGTKPLLARILGQN